MLHINWWRNGASVAPTLRLLRQARLEGFWSSCTLMRDPVFTGLRTLHDFDLEVQEAQRLEALASEAFRQALGPAFRWHAKRGVSAQLSAK